MSKEAGIQSAPPRSDKFDNLKLFLILCVIMGHLAGRYSASPVVVRAQFWIYLFHMPAFIFVSGLFAKRTIREGKWNKAFPYLLLYLFMEVWHYLTMVMLWGPENRKIDLFHENGIPWFGLSMFWWHMAAILVKKARPAYVMTASVLLAVASGYCGLDGSFLALRRSITFFPFFYLGYLTDREKLIRRLSGASVKAASLLVVAGSIFVSFRYFGRIRGWRALFRGVVDYAELAGDRFDPRWGFAWRIAAYLISMILTLALIAIMPSVRAFFTKLGRKTLPVYTFHGCVISILHAWIPSLREQILSWHTAIGCAALSVIILLITSLPVFEHITKAIMKPRFGKA